MSIGVDWKSTWKYSHLCESSIKKKKKKSTSIKKKKKKNQGDKCFPMNSRIRGNIIWSGDGLVIKQS